MWLASDKYKSGMRRLQQYFRPRLWLSSSHAIYPPAWIIHSCTQPICNKYKIQSLEIQIRHSNSQNISCLGHIYSAARCFIHSCAQPKKTQGHKMSHAFCMHIVGQNKPYTVYNIHPTEKIYIYIEIQDKMNMLHV